MFEIESVETIPIRIPMRKTVSFATGSLSVLEHVVVRIRSRDGVVGTAEAPSRPMVYGESCASIATAIKDWFAPILIGKQASDHDGRHHAMRRVEGNHTAKGAVDMACHDLVARTLKIPLVTLLGGVRKEVDVAHLLGLGSPEAVAAEALEIREAYGIGTFKLKAGMDPDRDTALIGGVRKLLGDDIRITVDCNHGYDPQTAARTLPRWEDYGVAWVEEPCQGLDPTSRGWVARSTSLPLMADESAIDVPQVVEEIRRGDCRFISIKLARGGYTRARQILNLCQAHDVGTVIGSQGDTDLGTLTAAHFHAAHAATAKYAGELSFFLEAEGGILTERPVISGGKLRLPEGSGHGGEIDEGLLGKYRFD